MRGYPPVHVLILLIAFGAMAVPLSHLTVAPNKPPAAASPQPVESQHVASFLRLRFAHQPRSVSLKLAGRELLASPALDVSPIETQVELDIPHDGIEVIVSAEWPERTPETALTLEIEPEGMETRTATRWSAGSQLTEVISFQWK